MSRNAVVGKAHRLGLVSAARLKSAGMSDAQQAARIRKPKRVAPSLRIQPPQPVASRAEIVPIGIGIVDLEAVHCRWVLDQRDDSNLVMYCGHPVVGPLSYCAGHCGVVYNNWYRS
jgi:hypothetical protein